MRLLGYASRNVRFAGKRGLGGGMPRKGFKK